jgi:hypothetical protein
MMTKFIRIAQKNFLSYLFDEFVLFRRDFVIETALEPQEIIERISSLENESIGCLWRRGVIVEIGKSKDGETTFRLTAKTPSRNRADSSAYIEGEIFDRADAQTRVAATAMIAGGIYWLAVIWTVFMLTVFFRDALALFGTFALAVLIFNYIQMYVNRNYLIHLLGVALNKPLQTTV